MRQLLRFIVPMLVLGNAAFAQRVVEGIIKDSLGVPVPGSTVVIKGTGNHSVTDTSGKFSISTKKELPYTLLIKSGGYKSREVQVTEVSGPLAITLEEENVELNQVTVTSRRRKEAVQDIPIPITVITGGKAEDAGAFNVNRLKELVPSVQLYSSNPRNTGISIRGLGASYGLTNDGLDPGVGFYVDNVYISRPAIATLDFIDVERIEVLRGPQGTLFGKNTTAGNFNVITRKPQFAPGGTFELSYGNYGYVQAKASITGPLIEKYLAARLSFSGTQRDGVVYNVRNNKYINDQNNIGARGQLLFTPTDKLDITLSGDFSQQRPDGYAQVLAGVAPTQRSAYRQFNSIITDLGYTPVSYKAFDRKVDQDTPWRSDNDLGGVSLNVDYKLGPGTLTSTTAWRYWNWGPSNDRDFIGVQSLAKSQNPSEQRQASQEVRYAATLSDRVSGVVGVFAYWQTLETHGTEESGSAQWRFAATSNAATWQTPGLFEGYGIHTNSRIKSFSGAVFANVDWNAWKGLHIQPGIRYNYDEKIVKFNRETYGGLQTTNATLLAHKAAVYSPQAYNASKDERNFTYSITTSYKFTRSFNAYATFSTNFKPVGVNVAGIPNISGTPALELAVIKPEYVEHYEAGIKTIPFKGSTFNVTAFRSNIKDYQTQVQAPDISVNRGYLANAECVLVQGVEADFNISVARFLGVYGGVTYTEAEYKKFTNAPLPLEETGAPVAFKDISGGKLPGISKWAGSLGAEFTSKEVKFVGSNARFFAALESYGRTKFSSSATPSAYLNINEYALLNARLGFRAKNGFSAFIWSRNILDKDYYEQLLPAGGNAGHYAAVLGDPRTYGITLRYTF